MIPTRWGVLLVFGALAWGAGGCASTEPAVRIDHQGTLALAPFSVTQPMEVATTPIEEEPYTLGPADVVGITVWGHAELSKITEVLRDGTMILPLVGGVPVKGLTLSEARERMGKAFQTFLQHPVVDVEVKEYRSRQVFFIGEVHTPGPLGLRRTTSLLEAISQAGGVTSNAYLKGAYLLRRGKITPIDLAKVFREGDLRQNLPVQDRDILYVPSVMDQKIYVLGEVGRPGVLPMPGGEMNLVEAIAAVGGFNLGAVRDEVKIVRGDLRDPTVISVDVQRIFQGERYQDLPLLKLAAGDIVYVPSTGLKKWNDILQQLQPSINFFLYTPFQIGVEYFATKTLLQSTGK